MYYNTLIKTQGELIMKLYIEEKVVNIPADIAWKVLKEMNVWLPKLSTNKGVDYDNDGVFFKQGRKYKVTSKEGVVMDSEIYSVDEANMEIEIHAEHRPLKSILKCRVIDLGNETCKLMRTQGYPGWFGVIFTAFWGKRESGETAEYLDVWKDYAKTLLN